MKPDRAALRSRTTILPQTPLLKEMLARMQEFHLSFIKKYQ